MNCTVPFDEVRPDDVDRVGGKGLSLGLLATAGLPIPEGYCITSETYRRAVAIAGEFPTLSEQDRAQIITAYEWLGRPIVAVRSSATFEDGAQASFAGQQETILGVEGDTALIAAVERCWASLNSARAVAYRQNQNVDESTVAMAVVVQRLVNAEVAGVLFTRDPLDATGATMLVEAAWGLGEAVVSGRVHPDRFHIDRQTGALLDHHVATKCEQMTASGWEPVAESQQSQPCLTPDQLRELLALGHRIEAFFGEPRDVEWAWDGRQFWILQARPITTAGAFEREQVRREEIATLRDKAAPNGTVWSRYNLAEILPKPTQMTWSIVKHFMSGRGGYGQMYRNLGYDPDPSLDDEGFIDLICGQPYVNLSREPKLYFRDFPFAHDFATLKANPERAMYPAPTADRSQATLRTWLKLPLTGWRMWRVQSTAMRLRTGCAAKLRGELFPEMIRRVGADRLLDPQRMSNSELLEHLNSWCRYTLVDFARQSLQPAVFAAATISQLEAKGFARESLDEARPQPEVDLAEACRQIAGGQLGRDEFVQRFGHRGPREMELAEPRWSERPESVVVYAARVQPVAEHRFENHDLSHASRVRHADPLVLLACDLLAVREEAKHYFMLGYSMIRRYLVALDERHQLAGGIFFLTSDELPRLIAGERFDDTIRERRRRRQIALSLDVPPVLFSDDLEAIGRPNVPSDATELKGTPISSGVFEGIAVVLEEPVLPADCPDDFVLVCPSTDPAWVPLFLRAKALVMESGGVLSHGAIVAREFALPAVAGLPGVQRRLVTGQRIRVDGNVGTVYVLGER
jgi:pyruvate,water dikinase